MKFTCDGTESPGNPPHATRLLINPMGKSPFLRQAAKFATVLNELLIGDRAVEFRSVKWGWLWRQMVLFAERHGFADSPER